jgi:hypothetical protein
MSSLCQNCVPTIGHHRAQSETAEGGRTGKSLKYFPIVPDVADGLSHIET